MYKMNDCFFNIPEKLLHITKNDILFLKNLLSLHEDEKQKVEGSSFYYKFFLKSLDIDYSSHIIFKKIAKLFTLTNKHHSYKHVYECSQMAVLFGSIIPHYDMRSCCLSIPLTDSPYPCHFYDDNDNEIHTAKYIGASLINGWKKHGVPENKGIRNFFHVGGFGKDEQFLNVVEKINGLY